MTFAERVHAIAEKGFTERQAGFLVTVMLHSGVCVRRQYCVYARIVHGQKDHDFFASLVAKKRATSYAAAHRRAHIYHVHSKSALRRDWRAEQPQPQTRYARPRHRTADGARYGACASAGFSGWVAERDKVEYFSTTTTLRLKELPHLAFGARTGEDDSLFPGQVADRRRRATVAPTCSCTS